ncbi:probable kinetochore protein NUF2, partial [Tanacetum coccineum]
DPLSPYLFTLVMEVLTLMLQRKVQDSNLFTYHMYYSKLELINLCFTDDWFLFSYGDVQSASVIKEALEEFKEGKLSVKYLGVLLVSSRLMIRDCNELLDMLLSLKESLWVKWIHEYKLNGRNFWDIPLRGNMYWGWRKILQLRPIIREFIWCKIGDCASTSLWFDRWCDSGPLASNISYRDIFRTGLNLTSKVKDVIHNSTWLWPPELLVKYPFLNECHVLIVEGNSDVLVWRNSLGITKHFSISQVWSHIRPRDTKVDWYNMVWFASCISRHAFNLWLIVRRKLKTQDLVRAWDVSDSLGTACSLCGGQPDSYDHLFFECSFAHAIWDRMKVLDGLDSSPPNIYSIINDLLPIARRRSMTSIVAKLVVAASAYFIWQERN